MRRQRPCLAIHQVRPEMMESDTPHIGEKSASLPYNCRTPCCYGRGRSYCWSCMQQILDAHSASRR